MIGRGLYILQYRQSNGYAFAVTLSRTNKKNEPESVRLEPHPPYVLPTALEARHWGATYALYRVSSLQYTSSIHSLFIAACSSVTAFNSIEFFLPDLANTGTS